jgi:hypothetical protein
VNTRNLTLLLFLIGAFNQVNGASAAESGTPPETPAIKGWNEFAISLQQLPNRLFAKLPVSMQNDAQVQQEIGRLMLAALASSTLDALGADGDYPAFLPQIGQTLNVGQPNADTVYRTARITPGGSYRLRGQRGSLRMANISEAGPMPYEPGAKAAPPGVSRTTHDLNALRVDAQGRFDVLLSTSRPPEYRGDWWQLDPSTTRLMLRMVSADWGPEQDPTVAIERVDRPMTRARRTAVDLEQRLRQIPAATTFIAALFVDHVAQLRAQGFINKLKVFDTAQLGGLAGQFYYEGAYELRDDEALIVEATAPKQCIYRSMILTNDLYETTDWYDNHSSLNDTQASVDSDGVLRIVVSAKDPGVPNWLDTAGYATGVIQGRWFQCDSQPVPGIRKVAFAEVRKSLPPGTKTMAPAERERLVRERRAAYQERPLW